MDNQNIKRNKVSFFMIALTVILGVVAVYLLEKNLRKPRQVIDYQKSDSYAAPTGTPFNLTPNAPEEDNGGVYRNTVYGYEISYP